MIAGHTLSNPVLKIWNYSTVTESRPVVAAGGGEEGGTQEGMEESRAYRGTQQDFGDGYVHYLDCVDSLGAAHICKNLSNCTL